MAQSDTNFKNSDAVHNWNDLKNLISSSLLHIQISSLTNADVYLFQDLHQKTLPKLKDVKAIMVVWGSTKMHFKFYNYEVV